MPSTEKLDTHRKALTLNLDASTFGSFAEIGAGQEVVRWFLVRRRCLWHGCEKHFRLRQGGQRQSLRDRFSLRLQGAAGSMLETEWTQLLGQLDKTRGPKTSASSLLSIRCLREITPEQTIPMAGLDFGSSRILAGT